ncbi:uncharacterized protein LOC111041917 [Myzus persicae]|uniref:uncharacterized protein LOC111041917 n=1 Tax=Myzus persicae TaxID=13164 RepID=UPI000B932164|nr:uncharacterized protein LOC111041917 [Myzus persicae]
MSRNMRSTGRSEETEKTDLLWNVVTFLDSKSCSVVPQSWLVKNPGSIVRCKWPKHKVTNKMIMKYQRPSEDWLEYDVKIIGLPYDSYEDALSRERLLINESSSETEPIQSCSIKKNKKNQKVNFLKRSLYDLEHNSETMTSDDTSPEYTPIKITKMSGAENINGSPINLRLSPNIISEAFNVLNNSCLVTNNYSDELNVDIQNYESTSNATRRQLFSNNDDHIESTSGIYPENDRIQSNSLQSSLVDDYSSHELLKKIHGTVVSINMYVQRLDARIDRLEKRNLFVENNSSKMTASSFDDTFLNLFPLKSTEDLTSIEQMIMNDKEFEFKMKSYMEIVGGTDAKNLIKRNLQRLFSNALAKKCSWTGSGRDSETREANHKLQSLKIMAFMLELCRLKFNCTDCEFEKNIKDWFRHGYQRYKRDLEKSTES